MKRGPDPDPLERDPGWWGSWTVASVALLLTVLILLLLGAGFVLDFLWGAADSR
jgi:hypothetical protein